MPSHTFCARIQKVPLQRGLILEKTIAAGINFGENPQKP